MSYAMPSSFQLPHHSSKIPLWPSPNLKHGKPIFCSTNTTSFPTKTSKEKTFEETCNKTKTTSPPSLPQSIFSHVSTMSKNLFLNTLNIIDPPLHPSIDPNLVFTGNFAPVSELDPTDCQVIEGELPLSLNGVYIRNGPNPQLQPRRRWEFTKKLLANMSAHPKVDIETKETFAFTTSLTFPHLSFFRFDSNGVKQKEVPISSVRKPTFLHDLAITKTFAIFCETQLGLAPAKVVMGRGALVDYKRDKVTRIGIIPRYSTDDSDMEWFQVPNFNAIHIFNAWESGEDEIVLVASNIISIENIYDRTCDIKLEKVKINMRTGQVSRNILSPRNLEFGSINPCYVGKKS
ncbi:Carotenoid oxygenase - like 10, partial [Theobroma cacao]